MHRVETAQKEKDDDKAEKEKDSKEEEEEDKEKEEKEEEKEEEDKEKEEKEEEKEEVEECGNENPLLGESDVIPFSSQSLVPFRFTAQPRDVGRVSDSSGALFDKARQCRGKGEYKHSDTAAVHGRFLVSDR